MKITFHVTNSGKGEIYVMGMNMTRHHYSSDLKHLNPVPGYFYVQHRQ